MEGSLFSWSLTTEWRVTLKTGRRALKKGGGEGKLNFKVKSARFLIACGVWKIPVSLLKIQVLINFSFEAKLGESSGFFIPESLFCSQLFRSEEFKQK